MNNQNASTGKPSPQEAAPRDIATDSRTTLVAVVDEDLHQRQSLTRGVLLHGYHCIAYDNRTDALAALTASQGDKINLVIVDISNDARGGFSFISRLRKCRGALPIILLRGLEWDGPENEMRADDIFVLQRPFTASTLAEAIHKLIE